MATSDDKAREASLRRKLKVLEDSNGDPAKIAELRFALPAERRSAPQVTVAKTPAPDVPKAPVAEPAAPKMAATRGIVKDDDKTPATDESASK